MRLATALAVVVASPLTGPQLSRGGQIVLGSRNFGDLRYEIGCGTQRCRFTTPSSAVTGQAAADGS
jgi:hypothetical protein